MKKILQQIKWDAVLISVLYVVLGIVCIVIPETMVKTLGYLIGALLIVAGAVSMICYLLREAYQNYYRNDFVNGLVCIAIGIIVLYKVDWLIELVPIILGVLVVTSGCRKLQDVIDMKRMEYGSWTAMLVLAAINVIFGAVVILNPFETLVLLFQLVGAGLIFSGVTDCFIVLYFAGRIKKYYEEARAMSSSYVEITGAEDENSKGKGASRGKGVSQGRENSKGKGNSMDGNSTEAGNFAEDKKSADKGKSGGKETSMERESSADKGTSHGKENSAEKDNFTGKGSSAEHPMERGNSIEKEDSIGKENLIGNGTSIEKEISAEQDRSAQ